MTHTGEASCAEAWQHDGMQQAGWQMSQSVASHRLHSTVSLPGDAGRYCIGRNPTRSPNLVVPRTKIRPPCLPLREVTPLYVMNRYLMRWGKSSGSPRSSSTRTRGELHQQIPESQILAAVLPTLLSHSHACLESIPDAVGKSTGSQQASKGELQAVAPPPAHREPKVGRHLCHFAKPL